MSSKPGGAEQEAGPGEGRGRVPPPATRTNRVSLERVVRDIVVDLRTAGIIGGPSVALLLATLVLAFAVTGLGLGMFLWQNWIPALWAWGCSPLSWRCIPAVVGEFYLVLAPLITFPFIDATLRTVCAPLARSVARSGGVDLRAMLKQLMVKRQRRGVVLGLALLGEAAALVLVGFAWFRWIPAVWAWADAGSSLLLVPGSLAILALALLPPAVALGFLLQLVHVAGQYLDAEQDEFREKLKSLRNRKELGGPSSQGLVELMQYASEELDVYYEMGRAQARSSFRLAVVAMSVGFLVLLAGLSVRFLPLGVATDDAGLANVDVVLLGTGAIIEAVAALFLWMYRSTMSQLTYFFDRQMYRHDVLACQWMVAESRNLTPEDRASVRVIVEKVLDRRWQPERVPLAEASRGATRLKPK